MNISPMESRTIWDNNTQRDFWNKWDTKHLQPETIGAEALERGNAVISLIQSLNRRDLRILEVGCGNGWLAKKMLPFGTVTGIDISDAAIAEAMTNVPEATFYSGDALSVNLKEKFDLVVTLETFSHVPDQPKFVQYIADHLNDGGHTIITTQNRTVCLRREDIQPPATGQLRRWVNMGQLKAFLSPWFDVKKSFSLRPSGHKGFLKLVNSRKINRVVNIFLPAQKIKEACNLGQTLVVLAQKKQLTDYLSAQAKKW